MTKVTNEAFKFSGGLQTGDKISSKKLLSNFKNSKTSISFVTAAVKVSEKNAINLALLI